MGQRDAPPYHLSVHKNLSNNPASGARDGNVVYIGTPRTRKVPSPLSGKGLGVNNFSWTAALVIDLLSEEKRAA
ncbi:hypothetical protein ES703_36270 [subsurface metagenome]